MSAFPLCPTCHARQVVKHEHDGYDDWRERLALAGVPPLAKWQLSRLAVFGTCTGSDPVDAYIALTRAQVQQTTTTRTGCLDYGDGTFGWARGRP